MAPLKRKRPHGAIPEPEQPPAPQPIARRATRQTSIAPLPAQPDPEPRRRRGRAGSSREPEKVQANGKSGFGKALDSLPVPQPYSGKENIPLPAGHAEPLKPSRKNTRLRGVQAEKQNTSSIPGSSDADNVRPGATMNSTPFQFAGARSLIRPTGLPNRRAQPVEPPQQPPTSQAPAAALANPASPMQSQQQQHNQHQQQQNPEAGAAEKAPSNRPDRNIDKVVFGNICFRAWYPSYYGKEVLGDLSGSSSAKSLNIPVPNGTSKEENGVKVQARRDTPPMLDRLYVCPSCFKYSKELVTWWEHVCVCKLRSLVPGKKIYAHPKGQRKVLVPATTGSKSGRGRRANAAGKMVEEVVQDKGEWSIWEVDGEQDVLFCQNLSLFAKLFLDNKSVFFDVTGFKYFLLVYTLPDPPSNPDADAPEPVLPPRKQVVGFFSKEKLSWDNNNLACILIFPPWQRKGLGALLMGISYEISKREGVLGGPEKPISDLGKKGYKRFWAGEICRWFLSLDTSGPGEMLVDVEECSRATWIAPEDCLQILREMDVAEDAGMGPPRRREPRGEAGTEEGEEVAQPDVRRVRITKEAVRRWVIANGINLDRPCDPNGFIEGYALQPAVAGEEGEEGDEEEEEEGDDDGSQE